MTNHQDTLTQLHNNLNLLREREREREAKHGGNAPLDLLNQITDHEQAIALTEQADRGELTEAKWRETLSPLLVNIRNRSESQPESCGVTIGDVEGGIIGSIIAGRDITADGDIVTGVKQTATGQGIAQATHGGTATVNIYNQPPTPPRDKNLSILLNNVRKIWIEDFLNSALLNAIYLDLGLQEKPDAVPQPFEGLNIRLRQPEQAERDLPAGTRAYDVYHQADGSLLILGQPGAGKTTTLATLAGDLVTEAERDSAASVPVIFNLSSWAAGQKPLVEWLADELYQQYQVSRKLGRAWLAEGRLALLLDGLDEVAESQRAACVSAINTYRAADATGPLVVCSRLADYEALQARLELKQALVLKKLTRPQVEDYFQRLQDASSDRSGERPASTGSVSLKPSSLSLKSSSLSLSKAALPQMMEEHPAPSAKGNLMTLFERIWQDEALRELVETPLMLNIITLTYAHPQALTLPQGEGESLRGQIFDAYTETMFNRVGHTQVNLLHPKARTLRYLRYLATQLQAHNRSQFSIGQMRGSWLPPGPISRWYRWLSGLSFRLRFGLSVGLSAGLMFGLISGLSAWLIGGLSAGLMVGLSDEKEPTESLHWAWRPVLNVFFGGVLGGLLGGGVVGLLAEAGIILPVWRAWGLIVGVIGGLISGLSVGLIFGLIFGLSTWLSAELSAELSVGLSGGLSVGLISGLSVGLIFGLSVGLSGEPVSHKIEPDQELRRSRGSALIGGLSAGLIGGLSAGLIGGLIGGLMVGLMVGLIFGLMVGLMVGLLYGGGFLIQHYLRLFLLNRHNLLPFRLIPFLNQATDLLFLQRLGGSYRFIHRSVQEHFAAQWMEENRGAGQP